MHLHTLDDDVAEIAFWVRWLRQRGIRASSCRHSFGNLQLLAYLKRTRHRCETGIDDQPDRCGSEAERAGADLLVRKCVIEWRKNKRLAEAEFGHCRNTSARQQQCFPIYPSAGTIFLIPFANQGAVE